MQTNYIPKLTSVKIKVYFSKRQLRSSILVFWCLFIVLGPSVVSKQHAKTPSSKIKGLGTNQGLLEINLRKRQDIFSFLDSWREGLAKRQSGGLDAVLQSETGLEFKYAQMLKPKNLQIIKRFDPGFEYFLAKSGVFSFQLGVSCYRNIVGGDGVLVFTDLAFLLGSLNIPVTR